MELLEQVNLYITSNVGNKKFKEEESASSSESKHEIKSEDADSISETIDAICAIRFDFIF